MNINIVYQYFQGPSEPGHSLVYELAHALSHRGHKVCVVTGDTGYMKRDKALQLPWYRRLLRRENDGPVSVLRTYTYPELHRNYFTRLLSFASFSASCAAGLLFLKRADVLLASSPPIFPMYAAGLVCKLRRIPFIIEIRDLWPESAVQMGILRIRWQIRLMAWMEKWLYDHSRRIVALTKGIKDDICSRGWPPAKIVLIPCGVDLEQLYPDPEAGRCVRKRHGWEGKKVILYFGALGEANNLDVVLKAAQGIRGRTDVMFVLIGDGMRRPAIVAQRNRLELDHVVILPPVPKQEARGYINSADLCLVTLKDIPLFEGAIPTKLLEYMACGKAILCGVRGEARRILLAAQAGVAFEPNDDRSLTQLIMELSADEARVSSMAANGPPYIRYHFSALDMHDRMERALAKAALLSQNPYPRPSSPNDRTEQ